MDNGSSGRLVNHEEGKGKGKTPPPAASKEPHAAANCRRIQPRRSLRVGASGGGVGSVVGAPVGASVCVGAAVSVGAPVASALASEAASGTKFLLEAAAE